MIQDILKSLFFVDFVTYNYYNRTTQRYEKRVKKQIVVYRILFLIIAILSVLNIILSGMFGISLSLITSIFYIKSHLINKVLAFFGLSLGYSAIVFICLFILIDIPCIVVLFILFWIISTLYNSKKTEEIYHELKIVETMRQDCDDYNKINEDVI